MLLIALSKISQYPLRLIEVSEYGKYKLDTLVTPFTSFLPESTYVFKQDNSTKGINYE